MFDFLQKDTKIRLSVDFEELTWDDLETLEKIRSNQIPVAGLKTLAAHCMVDENGVPVPEDKALKILGKLKKKDREEVLTKFFDAMQEALVPNPKGSDSTLPLSVGQEAATLPVGSQR